jgi:hypothetical protein
MKFNLNRTAISVTAMLMVSVYLFATAPAPLSDDAHSGKRLATKAILEIVNQQNSAVRALYTTEIVGAGKKVGIKFDEHYKDKDVHAGPLPAQFLRETARYLETTPVQLGLYLGSDYPINNANRFEGAPLAMFRQLRADRQPRFFRVEDSGRYAYLFADVAIANACVDCHNQHPQTPKNNWQLQDVMGATTWTYPTETLSVTEALDVLNTLHQAFGEAYGILLQKIQTMDQPPRIGKRWPRDGYYLPSVEVFMTEVESRIAMPTLNQLRVVTSGDNIGKVTARKPAS